MRQHSPGGAVFAHLLVNARVLERAHVPVRQQACACVRVRVRNLPAQLELARALLC